MKLLAPALVLASSGLVVAQFDLDDLPECAQPCVTEQITGNDLAGCGPLDIECICSNDGFLDDVACCLADACPGDEQEAAVEFARDICSGYGVDVPEEVVCRDDDNDSSAGGSSATASDEQDPTATESIGPTTATDDADSESDSESDSDSGENQEEGAGDDDDDESKAGPLAHMMSAGILGGIVAAIAML